MPAAEPPLLIAAVGSTNRVKVGAVEQTLASYLPAVQCRPYVVQSGIAEQPMTMAETLQGAKNRAKAALAAVLEEPAGKEAPCLSFGIESGMFSPDGGASYFDVCAVSLYDGSRHHVGFSCSFQIPPAIVKLVLEGGRDLLEGTNEAGLVDDPRLGEGQGLIGLLSQGRVDRLAYTKQSVLTAILASDPANFPGERARAGSRYCHLLRPSPHTC
jgi:inosine/xanthosine triphosphatase